MRSRAKHAAVWIVTAGVGFAALACLPAPAAGAKPAALTMAQAKTVPLTPAQATKATGAAVTPNGSAATNKTTCGTFAAGFTCSRSYGFVADGRVAATLSAIAVISSEGAAVANMKARANPAAPAKLVSATADKVVVRSELVPGLTSVNVHVRSGANILQGACASPKGSVAVIQACADKVVAAMKKKLAAAGG
jgi:hypothetical protein